MLFVLAVLLYLYISPARALFRAFGESSQQRHDVAVLQAQNRLLNEQEQALENPATLEQAARNLGLVLPGEHPYVVQQLPNN